MDDDSEDSDYFHDYTKDNGDSKDSNDDFVDVVGEHPAPGALSNGWRVKKRDVKMEVG